MQRILTSGMGLAAGIAAALANAGHQIVSSSEVAMPRMRGKSVAGRLFANERRRALQMPHRSAKELSKRYEEVSGRNGHTTIRRVA